MRNFRALSLLFGTITLLSACTPSPSSHPHGYVSHTNDRWLSPVIRTCFEQDGFERDKATVASTVTNEFAKAGFTFTGWERCEEQDKADLRIQFEKDNPGSQVLDFGNRLAGVAQGVILGLSHSCLNEYSGSHCQSNVALHEFGHALGLHHEMNRQDDADCIYQQTIDRAGEKDAIQIGDFDALSIMNYCHVFKANDKDQYLGLSAGDIATLKARYESPQAQLESHAFHILNDKTEFPGKVQGYRVTQYRYKIEETSSSDCKNPKGYSKPTPISEEIPKTALDGKPTQRRLRICLLGGDQDNVWQSFDHYTSKDFILKGAETNLPMPLNAVRLSESGKDFIRLDIDMTEPVPAAMVNAGLGKVGSPSIRVSSEPKVIVSDDEKTLSVLFRRDRALRENGTYFIKSLSVASRFHEGNYLTSESADAPLQSFFSDRPGLPNAEIEITDGFVETGKSPVLRSLRMDAQLTDYAVLNYFEVTAETDSTLMGMALEFSLDGESSGRVFTLYSTDIYPKGQGQYRVAVANNSLIYKGQYRLQSVKAYDYFGQETLIKIAASDLTIAGTESPVVVITRTSGFPLNARAPILKSIQAPTTFDASVFGQVLQVAVEIDSELPITNVQATFRGTHLGNQMSEYFSLPYFSKPEGNVHLIEPYSTAYMKNDVYRLTSLTITDAGQNVVTYEPGPGDELLPGTAVPIPSFKLTGRENPQGPDIRSIRLDANSYKIGETMKLRLTTTAESPLKSATVFVGSVSDPSFSVDATVENPDGRAETEITLPLDARFKSGEEYVIMSLFAYDANFDAVSLDALTTNDEYYWYTDIRVERFRVQ